LERVFLSRNLDRVGKIHQPFSTVARKLLIVVLSHKPRLSINAHAGMEFGSTNLEAWWGHYRPHSSLALSTIAFSWAHLRALNRISSVV